MKYEKERVLIEKFFQKNKLKRDCDTHIKRRGEMLALY